jgi:hypothetical protein
MVLLSTFLIAIAIVGIPIVGLYAVQRIVLGRKRASTLWAAEFLRRIGSMLAAFLRWRPGSDEHETLQR